MTDSALAAALVAAMEQAREQADAAEARSASGSSSGGAGEAFGTREASAGRDLSARATLAPGSYTLDYLASGPRPPVVRVYGTDTWRDVLSRLAHVFGSASPAMLSRLVAVGGGGGVPSAGQAGEEAGADVAALRGGRLVDARVGGNSAAEAGADQGGAGKISLDAPMFAATGRIVSGRG
jgi:hypothetical protein